MENLKTWKTIKQGLYFFEVDSESVGILEVIYENFDRKALFHIKDKIYKLKHNGFWKSNFEITDDTGTVILTSYIEKWYASTTVLNYKGKQLRLKIRNNPMAEYVIFDDEKEILAYGLAIENRKATVRINTNTTESDYVLDFLLWFTFVPLAQENMGDSFTFQSLLLS